jgi:hypothetical protein
LTCTCAWTWPGFARAGEASFPALSERHVATGYRDPCHSSIFFTSYETRIPVQPQTADHEHVNVHVNVNVNVHVDVHVRVDVAGFSSLGRSKLRHSDEITRPLSDFFSTRCRSERDVSLADIDRLDQEFNDLLYVIRPAGLRRRPFSQRYISSARAHRWKGSMECRVKSKEPRSQVWTRALWFVSVALGYPPSRGFSGHKQRHGP